MKRLTHAKASASARRTYFIMHDHSDNIVLLTSTPTEMQAGIIVAALEENGIKAMMTGQTVAGFRAEAPGWVQVLVTETELANARRVLEEMGHAGNDIDWSQVDVGEPEDE